MNDGVLCARAEMNAKRLLSKNWRRRTLLTWILNFYSGKTVQMSQFYFSVLSDWDSASFELRNSADFKAARTLTHAFLADPENCKWPCVVSKSRKAYGAYPNASTRPLVAAEIFWNSLSFNVMLMSFFCSFRFKRSWAQTFHWTTMSRAPADLRFFKFG